MFWVLPAIQAGVSVWNAVNGKKAADQAARQQAERDRFLSEGTDLARKQYEDWKNGEGAWLRSQNAMLRTPGLSDYGKQEQEQFLTGANKSLLNLRRSPRANASSYLALDLDTAKNMGGINLRDAILKRQMIGENYRRIQQGEAAGQQALQSSLQGRAGVAQADSRESRAAAGSAWNGVANGIMGLAQTFAQMGSSAPSTASTSSTTSELDSINTQAPSESTNLGLVPRMQLGVPYKPQYPAVPRMTLGESYTPQASGSSRTSTSVQ